MKMYKVELEQDCFEIIYAETNEEAIEYALNENEFVYNVILLDDNYDEVETIF